MKVWVQDEFDLVKTGADGQYRLGKGDFRRVNMRGYTRLILGAGSLLGAANIGANSEIGAHCDFDAGAVIGHGSIIGARCHFGKGAWIKSGCIVGHGVCFGDGAVIERGVELEGGVELPAKVELFGVKNADGRTMLTIAPVIGGTLHAFRADGPGIRQPAGAASAAGGICRVCGGSGRVCGVFGHEAGQGRGARAAGRGELHRGAALRGVNLLYIEVLQAAGWPTANKAPRGKEIRRRTG